MSTTSCPSSQGIRKRAGFTLMEVMVSSALTLVILAMLFGILMGAMNAWQTGSSRLQENADARMALDLIARDLQSMVVRQTTIDQEWLVSGPVVTPGDPTGTSNPHTSNWLMFFSPSLDRDAGQEGDIVAVSYRVGYQDPMTNNTDSNYKLFGLYKQMESTTNTFLNVLGLQDIMADHWMAADTLNASGLIIPNVVDFSINWQIRQQNGDIGYEPEVVRLGNTLTTSTVGNPLRIVAADISLTVVNDAGAKRLQLLERTGNLGQNQLNDVITQFGRVFTTRVKIEY
ncbi:MAG: prepilin-type N-terminal cleavage/methylation domain-containing protein [Verrucomicrobia bacterium]|nr:prepilin-type N-terminal cleavage/methylation domain-containing protein [Verrucomicrobiota bacterium]MCH8510909.1 prepilin-type N-terminal cleavage/methylation domain-containing protein [Kiritimatiellia bacterium]